MIVLGNFESWIFYNQTVRFFINNKYLLHKADDNMDCLRNNNVGDFIDKVSVQ